MTRDVVYTCLFGDYEELLEQPQAGDSEMDFLCFTDGARLRSDTWQIKHVSSRVPGDPQRSSRYPKIHPHIFLGEYKTSLYIDNTVLLRKPPETLVSAFLSPQSDMCAFAHSFRDSLEDEFAAVIRSGRDTPDRVLEQLRNYRESRPEILRQKPVIGGVLVRNHMSPLVIDAMERWWRELQRFSRRDQLSLMVALAASALSIEIAYLDIRNNEYWEWPVWRGRGRR